MKTGDLVMIRLPNDVEYKGRQRHYNTWFEVLFIDNDGTFIGEVKKIDRMAFTLHKIGDHIRNKVDAVQEIYDGVKQFCYGDGVTTCDCPGLCRNK